MKKIITINNDTYIVITSNVTTSVYSYYKNDTCKKTTFNKYSFIEYLKSIHLPKKYINEI